METVTITCADFAADAAQAIDAAMTSSSFLMLVVLLVACCLGWFSGRYLGERREEN